MKKPVIVFFIALVVTIGLGVIYAVNANANDASSTLLPQDNTSASTDTTGTDTSSTSTDTTGTDTSSTSTDTTGTDTSSTSTDTTGTDTTTTADASTNSPSLTDNGDVWVTLTEQQKLDLVHTAISNIESHGGTSDVSDDWYVSALNAMYGDSASNSVQIAKAIVMTGTMGKVLHN